MIVRKEENGPQGDGVNENISFTLNTIDHHAVVYALDRETYNAGQNFARTLGISTDGINSTLNAQGTSAVAVPTYAMTTGCHTQVNEEKAPTLATRDYKDAPIVNEPVYAVRRLTPDECCRLQGYPDGWCDNLETETPTEEEILKWEQVWSAWNAIQGKRPKTRSQVMKWLLDPKSDAAEYKAYGNSVCLNVVCYVLSSIVYQEEKQKNRTLPQVTSSAQRLSSLRCTLF